MTHVLKLLVLSITVGSTAAAAQASMTPERYFACQIVVQQATIAGLEAAADVAARNGTRAESYAAAEHARAQVEAAGTQCGASPNAMAAYAHRSSAHIKTWLAEHPEVQGQLDDLSSQIDALSGASGLGGGTMQ